MQRRVFGEQRQAGDIGRFRGQRHEVVTANLVHVFITQCLGDRGDLPAQRLEVTMDVLRLQVDVVTRLVFRILGRDTDRAGADVALHAGDTTAGDNGRGTDRGTVRA